MLSADLQLVPRTEHDEEDVTRSHGHPRTVKNRDAMLRQDGKQHVGQGLSATKRAGANALAAESSHFRGVLLVGLQLISILAGDYLRDPGCHRCHPKISGHLAATSAPLALPDFKPALSAELDEPAQQPLVLAAESLDRADERVGFEQRHTGPARIFTGFVLGGVVVRHIGQGSLQRCGPGPGIG